MGEELPPTAIFREGQDPLPRRVDPPEESLTQSQFTTQLQEPTEGNGCGAEFHVDRLDGVFKKRLPSLGDHPNILDVTSDRPEKDRAVEDMMTKVSITTEDPPNCGDSNYYNLLTCY